MQGFTRGTVISVVASALLSYLALAAPAQDQAAPAVNQISATTNANTAAAAPSIHTAPPQVVYQNGQLTISSENSTLREIFDAIRVQTGASIEGAAIDDSIRLATHLGPGSVHTILGDLVYGTPFNLLITTSAESPEKINRIVLTKKLNTAEMARLETADHLAAKAVEKSGRNSVGENIASRVDERNRPSTTADAIPTNRPALPPGIPSEMWNLYPQLLQQNTGLSTPNLTPENIPPLQNARNSQNTQPVAVSPPPGGYPALPRGIPPEIWTLYPPNIMQLIQNAGPPPAPTPRPATVPTTLWDQALPVQH
ncbi:MAG TPA: hypothetical protein VEG30_02420 [Terriglobales bacterium]|nr:hypothetical protein [Terriglobales bacterium]